jgi:hypothetical protein
MRSSREAGVFSSNKQENKQMTTKLVEALRKNFPDARSALRKLGLDETLLDDTGELLRKNPQKFIDLCIKRYGSQKAVLSRLGMDASMLDEPAHMKSDPRGGSGGEVAGGTWRKGEDSFDVPEGSRSMAPKVEQMPAENTGEDALPEEEERSLQEQAADWKRRGATDQEIERHLGFARDALRRHHRRAQDRLPARIDIQDGKDRMPLNHLDANNHSPMTGVAPPQGLDSSINSSRREINEIHRQLKRFGFAEAGCAPERYRGAQDAVPTMARRARTEARYPGLARIGEA